MKQILPAGERCVLFSRLVPNSIYKCFHSQSQDKIVRILNFFYFKVTRVCTLLAMICIVSTTVSAQKSVKSLKHFQIGDKISKNLVLGTSLEDSTKVITMKDYRGKAVILDFWATYCATCIAKFPMVDNLSKIYHTNFEVVLVHVSPSRENRTTVQNFINKFKDEHPDFNLPIIMINEIARQKFFVPTIPHYVWVDANGRIQAITNSFELTEHNLKEFIAGRTLKLRLKTK